MTAINKLDDKGLIAHAWRLTTNNRRSGGASVKGLAATMRRLRRMGVRFYIGGWFGDGSRNSGTCWGVIIPGQPDPTIGLDWMETGVSINEAAHKLGAGNAPEGWRRYWGA